MNDRDDRFSDLGGEGERRSAAERLAERDETHPEQVERPPEVPRPGNKYAWVVGIVMLMGLGVLLWRNTLPNEGEALFGLERGERLPAFAVPLGTSRLEGDANVCQRRPCGEGSGPVPACEVDSPKVLNGCKLRRRPLVLTFVFDRGADCFPQVDRTERVRRRLPEVTFATVYFTRKKRSEVSRLIMARGWSQPVGIDRDGGLVNRFGVGGCPTTVFVRPGGTVQSTQLGNLTESQLVARARQLTR